MAGSDGDQAPANNEENVKRPILSKYATTTHSEKFPPVLTGDFDKNLTIEKAKFESSSGSAQQPTLPVLKTSASANTNTVTSTAPAIPPIPETEEQQQMKKSPPLTTSVTLPIVTTIQSLGGPTTPTTAALISTVPSQSTPLLNKSKTKVEDRRSVKRKKLPAMSGTATPSEVFHRNLVDAVSNVEDSDENEQYVYPYSGNNTDSTYHVNSTDTIHRTTSSSLYRPQSTRSFKNNSQYDLSTSTTAATTATAKRGVSTGFFNDLFRPILFKSKSDSRAILHHSSGDELASNRPKLRNYVMDHPFNSSGNQAKLNNSGSEWTDGGHSPPHHNSRRNTRKMYSNYVTHDGGYTTDDEEAQHLLAAPRRSLRKSSSSSKCSRLIRNILLCLLSLVILVFLLITYLAKPLKDLNVEMGRVLSSDKELIFDLHLKAINTNLWPIHVADADISVFAFSQVVPMNNEESKGVDPAEYLGGFYHFDEPLLFRSSFYSREPVKAISQIRIKSPGADKSGNERWSRIIRYPYGLVVRGVLKYKPLPFLSYPQSIAICDVVRVNPTTGKISEDPDQGYCLSYGNNSTITTTLSY